MPPVDTKLLVKKPWPEKPDVIAFLICAGIFFSWMQLFVYKFSNFGYYDWDLGIYANAMWALAHGSFHASLWGTNFLTNHPEYISILIAPLYKIFPSALTLITLKLLSVIAGGYVFYLIVKERLGWILGIIMMLLYFAFPANFFMLIFEFHFESLAIVFLFLVYYYLHTKPHYGKFVLCCILASLCKENIPPVIFMFGFMSLFQKENSDRRFAWMAMSIGASIFIIEMFIILPWLRRIEGLNAASVYLGLYWSGEEKLSLTQNLLLNAKQLSPIVLSGWNKEYVKDLFLPLLLLPLWGFKTLLIALPLFLQAILSKTKSMHTVYFHYAATVTPFLFLATFEAISWSYKKLSKFTTFSLIFLLIIAMFFNARSHSEHFLQRIAQWEDANDIARQTLIQQVPKNASVIGTFEFLSHLADREHVYPLRNVWLNYNIFTSASPYTIPQTQYALIDWDCPWLWGETVTKDKNRTRESLNRLKNFYFSNNWHVQDAAGDIVLLSKTPTDRAPLVEIRREPFPDGKHPVQTAIKIDNTFELIRSTVSKNTAITFYWKATTKTDDVYIADIHLYRNGKSVRTSRHHIGYAVYSTPLWQNGDYIQETYWVNTLGLPEGEYSITIKVANLTQNRWSSMVYQAQSLSQIPIGSFTIQSPQGSIPHEK